MKSRIDRAPFAFVFAAIGGLLFGAAVALAHTEGHTNFIDSGNGWCEYGRAAINAEQRDISATVWSYEEGCTDFKAKNPYKLRTKATLLREGNDGEWNQCSEGFWGHNTTETYATAQIRSFGGRPCAEGRYKTRGHVGLEHNQDWKGGTVNSPAHHW